MRRVRRPDSRHDRRLDRRAHRIVLLFLLKQYLSKQVTRSTSCLFPVFRRARGGGPQSTHAPRAATGTSARRGAPRRRRRARPPGRSRPRGSSPRASGRGRAAARAGLPPGRRGRRGGRHARASAHACSRSVAPAATRGRAGRRSSSSPPATSTTEPALRGRSVAAVFVGVADIPSSTSSVSPSRPTTAMRNGGCGSCPIASGDEPDGERGRERAEQRLDARAVEPGR